MTWLRHTAGSGSRRVLCFPHAGGGTSAFHDWRRALPAGVELWVAQLPGRESRLREPPPTELDAVVGSLVDALHQLPPLPCTVYGHSFGALVAYEVARAAPATIDALIVSGMSAPHLPRPALANPDLVAELRSLGGTAPEVLSDPELLDLILPALRADLAMSRAYQWPAAAPLAVPILAIGGSSDPYTTPATIAAWHAHTRAAFHSEIWPGDHMFPRDHVSRLVARVSALG